MHWEATVLTFRAILSAKAHFIKHCNVRILPITQPYPNSHPHLLVAGAPRQAAVLEVGCAAEQHISPCPGAAAGARRGPTPLGRLTAGTVLFNLLVRTTVPCQPLLNLRMECVTHGSVSALYGCYGCRSQPGRCIVCIFSINCSANNPAPRITFCPLILPHISRPPQSIREVVPNRMQKPGVMATLNLFLEIPATPDGELPPIRSKASPGELLLFLFGDDGCSWPRLLRLH